MPPNPSADAQAEHQARVQAERTGGPFLVFRDGDGQQQLFSFTPELMQATVGRQPSADLVLGWDTKVSRLHARFQRTGEDWILVDDGMSSNGTFVNEQRLSGKYRLSDGDRLRFGSTTMTFRWPERQQPQADDVALTPSAVGLSTTQRRVLAALCRPYKGRSGFASPATDEQIAEELFLSVGAVRAHLKVLSAKLEIGALPQSETRVRLVELAFSTGLISERDL